MPFEQKKKILSAWLPCLHEKTILKGFYFDKRNRRVRSNGKGPVLRLLYNGLQSISNTESE